MSAGDLFFVDSNLLLYFADLRDPRKNVRAAEWLDALWSSGTGRLSWQVLNEFYSNAVGKIRMRPSVAREFVEEMAKWRPVDSSLGLLQEASHWTDTAQVSHWDALILAAAHRAGARYLLSEDFQAGRTYGDVQVLNPFDHSPSEYLI